MPSSITELTTTTTTVACTCAACRAMRGSRRRLNLHCGSYDRAFTTWVERHFPDESDIVTLATLWVDERRRAGVAS